MRICILSAKKRFCLVNSKHTWHTIIELFLNMKGSCRWNCIIEFV
uniref:Uncharacterized protein n=1 Tax=Arundo donax TaxID=35708 RepID=A0A0A9HL48_ARUDO